MLTTVTGKHKQKTNSDTINAILNSISLDEFKSIFFLLQDYLLGEDFLCLVRKNTEFLTQELKKIYLCQNFEVSYEFLLIEIFGTLKRYDILKQLGSCQHIFNCKKQDFKIIRKIWKLLYELSENLTDNDLVLLKKNMFPEVYWNDINCAEELFFLAVKEGCISEDNLSALKSHLCHIPECLSLIQQYLDEISNYPIKQPTSHSKCGIAVIINHEDFDRTNDNLPPLQKRIGSKLDVDKLTHLWQCFGFNVRVYSSLMSDEDVYTLFKDISREDHSSYDAFIACYLSHGNADVVYAPNCKEVKVEELVNIIANSTPTLSGKPKCFFIQACQGTNIQQVVPSHCFPVQNCEEINHYQDAVSLTPCNSLSNNLVDSPRCCDVVKVTATIPGYVSFRSPQSGSWFVTELVDVMMKFGDAQTIQEVLTKVIDNVTQRRGDIGDNRNCAQTPVFYSSLRRQLKFKKLKS